MALPLRVQVELVLAFNAKVPVLEAPAVGNENLLARVVGFDDLLVEMGLSDSVHQLLFLSLGLHVNILVYIELRFVRKIGRTLDAENLTDVVTAFN